MTEVSGLRNTGRTPRPLGEVKDDSSYLQSSNYNVRHVTHGDVITTTTTKSPRQLQEMRESIRHAALINIVAAVNDNYNVEFPMGKSNSSSTENNNNTMSLISNLVLPKERTISIPTSPVLIEDPKFSKKKPVYFMHSENEVPNKDVENRKQGIILSRTRNTVPVPAGTKVHQTVVSPVENGQRKEALPIERVNNALQNGNRPKLPSPKRYFVALTKRNECEKQATLSKCDAVDILDTTDSLPNAKTVNSPTGIEKQISSTIRANTNSSMYRAKSFPALFPVKRQKLGSTIPGFKSQSARIYGGIPNVLLGKNVNSESVSGYVSPNGNFNETELETVSDLKRAKSRNGYYIKKEGITLEGRSLITPGTDSNSNGSTPQNHKGIIKIPTDGQTKLVQERDIMKEIDDQFLELQKRIATKLSSFGENTSISNSSVSQCDNFSTYGLTGRGFRSQSESSSKIGKREKKRVKFADLSDYDSKGSIDSKSVNSNSLWDENGNVVISVQGVGNKIYSPRKNVGFKPMSAGELVRLKKRLLPNNYKDEQKSRFDVVGNIKISSLGSRETSQVSTKSLPTKQETKPAVSDCEVGSDVGVPDLNGKEVDYTDRDCVNLPKSQGMSSFYPHQDNVLGYEACDEDDYDSDENSEKSYRVLKAVDLQTLSGYQHRKFKKPEALQETPTAHFIKIKVKS